MAEIPIANIYYLLCYAWDVLDEKDSLADVDALESTELLELFARVLNSGTRRLLRRGLDRGYLPQEGELCGIRGKMLLSPTLRGDLVRQGRSVCQWDELEYSTLPNRLIKTTLEQLHHADSLAGAQHAQMQESIRDLLRWLRPIESVEIRSDLFRRVQLHRNNRIYAFLLHICEFIHEHWLPSERGQRRFRDFVREGLPKLFEKFILNFYRHHLPADWKASSSVFGWHMEFANADAMALVPELRTDVSMRGPDRAIILDTKFYANALASGQFGSGTLSSANLNQVYTYCSQRAVEPGWENVEGVLLYPRTTRDFSADFVTRGHRIRAMTLDLTAPWQRIESELLAIVN
jgi:5-methylcytosine-specific restriction enzyme subunit McrC